MNIPKKIIMAERKTGNGYNETVTSSVIAQIGGGYFWFDYGRYGSCKKLKDALKKAGF